MLIFLLHLLAKLSIQVLFLIFYIYNLYLYNIFNDFISYHITSNCMIQHRILWDKMKSNYAEVAYRLISRYILLSAILDEEIIQHTQHNTVQHNTTQHNTIQHNITQNSTTQHTDRHTQIHTHTDSTYVTTQH